MAQYEKLINLSLLNQFLTKAKTIFAPKITASGILKGDGNGNVSAATAGTDYLAPNALTPYRTAAAQDAIDAGKEASGLGLTGASVGDLVRVNAVDANGKPTSWKHVPLNEIKCSRNYLDNWYFANPVNQRRQTSYSNTGYTIDRWKLTSGSVEVVSGGITLNGTIVQILETSIGQIVTASALLTDGTIITPTYNDTTKIFTLTATGQTIKAVKLELGPEQTLAHNEGTEANPIWVLNEIPDYGEELAKCKRYLQIVYNNTLCLGMSRGNRQLFMLPLVAPMVKERPTISGMNGAAIITQSGSTTIGKPQNITVYGGTSALLSVGFDESTVMTNWGQNALITTDEYFYIIAE